MPAFKICPAHSGGRRSKPVESEISPTEFAAPREDLEPCNFDLERDCLPKKTPKACSSPELEAPQRMLPPSHYTDCEESDFADEGMGIATMDGIKGTRLRQGEKRAAPRKRR